MRRSKSHRQLLTRAAAGLPLDRARALVDDPEVTEMAREVLRMRIRVLEGDLGATWRELMAFEEVRGE